MYSQTSAYKLNRNINLIYQNFLFLQLKAAVKEKQEKVDATLKNLHQEMVVKKPQTPKATPKKANKKGGAKTKNIQKKLGKIQV